MTATATPTAVQFASALEDKMRAEYDRNYTYTVKPGRKFDKIVAVRDNDSLSVFAFMDRQTGDLYKPATWAAPAKGVRYLGSELFTRALDNADPNGGFLYVR